MVKKSIMAEDSFIYGGQEAERGAQSKIQPPVTSFLQLGPTLKCLHHLPVKPSDYEPINTFIY
jgi:hypothetical protein